MALVNDASTAVYELICVIADYGVGSKVIKIAGKNGVSGGSIVFGMGTVKNRILEFLALADVKKEIILMVAEKSVADNALEALDKEFEFRKPYHGIAFTLPLTAFLGAAGNHDYTYCKDRGNAMYQSIVVIVDKGKAEFVMDSATDAGARGGTVIKGRGSGAHETAKLFHMNIEPEKEIVIILSEAAKTEKIVNSIRDRLEIGVAGKGIIFCQDVGRVYGLS